MRILIATPLYPPDTASHATYVKELALRLREHCQVTVLAYNHIPEQIEGVCIISIEKNQTAFVRVTKYIFALLLAVRSADVVYIQNGPSVELPMLLVAPITSVPFVLRIADKAALRMVEKNVLYRTIHHLAQKLAQLIVVHPQTCAKIATTVLKKSHEINSPDSRPEILPFTEYPRDAFERYNSSWNDHIKKLLVLFSP